MNKSLLSDILSFVLTSLLMILPFSLSLTTALAFTSLISTESEAAPLGYVTRQETGEVVVVDLSDGTIQGTIATPLPNPFEIALSPDETTLFVTHANTSGAVSTLDLESVLPPKSVNVGSVPIEITVLPEGSKFYTADWLGGSVSVVDVASNTNIAAISTNFLCYDVAASPDGGIVYATSLRSTGVFVIDSTTDTLNDFIPVGRTFLGHIAITPDGSKAYVTEFRDNIVVLDLTTGTVVNNIEFEDGQANPNNGALDIEIDSQGNYAYVLGYDTVNVIDLATDELVTTIQIGKQVSDVVVDSIGSTVYVTTLAETIPSIPFTEIVKIDTSTHTILDRFVIGGGLVGIAVENIDSPIEMLESLIAIIDDMDLVPGAYNPLRDKADGALKKLTDTNPNNDNAASSLLSDFISIVEKKAGRSIDQIDADLLIAAAEEILMQLINA